MIVEIFQNGLIWYGLVDEFRRLHMFIQLLGLLHIFQA